MPAYFELPEIEGRNPHRFAQCFFRRVVRALRLSPRELLRLDASFELRARAHHANGTKRILYHANGTARDGKAGGGMRYRCHPWVELFGRNSSTDCTQHDNKIRDKIRSENRADQAADDPSGSSRGAHNYPSPNAALTRTQPPEQPTDARAPWLRGRAPRAPRFGVG